MRRFIIGLALLAACAAPSHAQRAQKPDNALSPDERVAKSVADEVDRQYKATLTKTRKDVDTRVDPWSNMRGADASKPKN
jgi:hypothetical protein